MDSKERQFHAKHISAAINHTIVYLDKEQKITEVDDIRSILKNAQKQGLGQFTMLVCENGLVSVMPSYYISKIYRNKSKYFHYKADLPNLMILKKQYRNECREFVDHEYLYDIRFY